MGHRIDQDEQIFHLDLDTGMSGSRTIEQAVPVLQSRPELWGWDWIVNVPAVPTDVTVEDVARLADLFPKPDRQGITAFASADRFLHLWARVMDFQFPGRKHLVVPDVAAAGRIIGLRRAQGI